MAFRCNFGYATGDCIAHWAYLARRILLFNSFLKKNIPFCFIFKLKCVSLQLRLGNIERKVKRL
jgi:hypothetical protein